MPAQRLRNHRTPAQQPHTCATTTHVRNSRTPAQPPHACATPACACATATRLRNHHTPAQQPHAPAQHPHAPAQQPHASAQQPHACATTARVCATPACACATNARLRNNRTPAQLDGPTLTFRRRACRRVELGRAGAVHVIPSLEGMLRLPLACWWHACGWACWGSTRGPTLRGNDASNFVCGTCPRRWDVARNFVCGGMSMSAGCCKEEHCLRAVPLRRSKQRGTLNARLVPPHPLDAGGTQVFHKCECSIFLRTP
eukprot:363350-Chlamydomonas_euryale.AAC.7